MKIALLHYSAPPIVGGVESVLAHHARLMAEAGHEVIILAGRGRAFDPSIQVRILPRLDSRQAEVMVAKRALDAGQCPPGFGVLRDRIRRELTAELRGVDILIAHNVASLHKNLALTAAIHDAHQNPGFPHLILWHHDLAWTTPRYRRELYEGYPWNLLKEDWGNLTHVVVSELRRQELDRLLGITRNPIRVIPNGVDVNAFFKLEPLTIRLIETLKLLEANPLFLLPVRLTPRKNIELALRILAQLRQSLPEAVLLVTGPEGPHNPANATYKRKLLALRDQLGLRGAVHFLAEVTEDFLPDAVIADFFRLSDALLFPSLEEGFGIPIIEAAFSSMPVFCTDISVLREVGGADVSYFDLHADPAAIADQISVRLKSEATSRFARRAKHGYSWNSIYRLYIGPLIQESTR